MAFLSIDPGVNNCGLSVIDVSEAFKVIHTECVKNARKFTEEEKALEIKFGNRAVKIMAIVNRVRALINEYNLEGVAFEAPFYHSLTPTAYGSLLEVMFAIKYMVLIESSLFFKSVEPLLVKKLFSNHSLASKEVMRQFLINKTQSGEITLDKEIDSLTEHEVDSIAVGYTHWLGTREETSNVGSN